MNDTTQTPRAHAAMAARFMADSSLMCWQWDSNAVRWDLHQYPNWHEYLIYHVGHEVPTDPPKRKVTIAGITFDAPETKDPELDTEYWLVWPVNGDVSLQVWHEDSFDQRWLGNGLVHLDKENASLHAQALNKLNRQLCGLEDAE